MTTSYLPEILTWAVSDMSPESTDPELLAHIERDADAAHERTPGMHDTRVEIIVHNAFNGMGDSTGSDEFGYSVACIDLSDHLDYDEAARSYSDIPDGVDYWNLGAYLATWRDMSGCRYALAYWDADGSRSVVGYTTHADMLHAYRAIEAEYLVWEESNDAEEEV